MGGTRHRFAGPPAGPPIGLQNFFQFRLRHPGMGFHDCRNDLRNRRKRDLFRQKGFTNAEQIFTDFSDYYTQAMSEKLEVSSQFARSMFIYMLGLILHSLLTPKRISYTQEVSNLRNTVGTLLEHADSDPATLSQKVRHILNNFVCKKPPKESNPDRALKNTGHVDLPAAETVDRWPTNEGVENLQSQGA